MTDEGRKEYKKIGKNGTDMHTFPIVLEDGNNTSPLCT